MRNVLTGLFVIVFSISGLCQNVEIDSLFSKYESMENAGVVVVVLKDGELTYKGEYGYENIDSRKRISSNRKFYLGDISKQITSLAILNLVKEGELDFDDYITKYIDLPKSFDSIKVGDLLTHTSGIKNFSGYVKKNKIEGVNNAIIDEFLNTNKEAIDKPGIRFNYSLVDYYLLSKIVERCSGKRYDKYIKKLLKKFDVKDVSIIKEWNPELKRLVNSYSFAGNKIGKYDDKKMVVVQGNSDVVISIDDLIKIENDIVINKVFRKEDYNYLWEHKEKGIGKFRYSGGTMIDFNNWMRYYFQGGVNAGFSCSIVRIPSEKISILIFSNQMGVFGMRKDAFRIIKMYSDYHYIVR